MSSALAQLIVLAVAMFASGAIGFWIARERYRSGPMNYGGHKPLPDTPAPRARMAPTVQ